jgi:hypothetical protein
LGADSGHIFGYGCEAGLLLDLGLRLGRSLLLALAAVECGEAAKGKDEDAFHDRSMLILVKDNYFHVKEFSNGLEIWPNVAIFTTIDSN